MPHVFLLIPAGHGVSGSTVRLPGRSLALAQLFVGLNFHHFSSDNVSKDSLGSCSNGRV